MIEKNPILKSFDYSKIKKCCECDFSNEKGICKFFHLYAGLHNGCIKEPSQEAERTDMELQSLDLSVRTYNGLRRQGIDTIEKLQSLTDEELKRVRNIGEKGFNEVKEKLSKLAAEPK
ncbi:DNA-directed RNA polymerase subunit alpha C-terminal domain-containing protein [Anaerocolumna chitinilytica]|uniref:RNA polymerase alpha subunit C-terminal domain-containing protein n=1 Tax=Anaerocolumna chitinilytica TaxID=1727145 RepID=A0A7M3SA10_9FIRM|nr:DNA-directed RNA polymerase subunit alpha C-terminal domain-containing protein [Anaerocolumna chitinilytica]BCK01428.1 hypothetical protein bsdcttw_44680 [Anaerocolumna chitinilytica]